MSMAHPIRRALTVGALAAVLLGAAAVEADSCPLLKNAVYTTPDYNRTDLGLPWFTRRGLQRDGQYGCMTPDANANNPYTFALGCQCAAWATCHSRNLEYSVRIDDHHSSRLGECRCCSWWLITLIVIGSLGIILFATQVPRMKRYYDRKMRERRRAKRSAMAAMEEGDGQEFSGIGSHTELNGSANDRYNSELKDRRSQAPRLRRKPSQRAPSSGNDLDQPPLTRDATLPGGAQRSAVFPPVGSPQQPAGAARPSWEPPGADRANAYAIHDEGAAVPVYLERATPQFDASGSGLRTPQTAGSPNPAPLDASFGSQPDAMTGGDEDTR